MVVPLQQCTKQEQRSVVRFLFSEGVKLIQIHRRMRIQYSDRCTSRTQVYEWTEEFKNGVTSVEDSPPSGPAFTAVAEDNIAAVENVIGKTSMSQSRRWHHYWTLVLDQPITSFMTS